MQSKVVTSAAEAIRVVQPGMAIMVGGFAPLLSWPNTLLHALADHSAGELTVIANTVGHTEWSPQILAERKLIRRYIASFGGKISMRTPLEEQILAGEVAFEVVPQGTLAERIRAAGAGIAGFYTLTGAGTVVETPEKAPRLFNGRMHIFERALGADVALLHATVADEIGNCVLEGTTKNLQTAMATAAKRVLVEAERIVPTGALDPMRIDLPGIFVDTVVPDTAPHDVIRAAALATRRNTALPNEASAEGRQGISREQMALRAALLIAGYRYVNLGIGIPTLVARRLQEIGSPVFLHSESGLLGYRSSSDFEQRNSNYFDAASEPVALLPGSATFDSATAFTMARGGHLDAVVLGGYQVSQHGDLANWDRAGTRPGMIGGAMDLVAGGVPVIVVMEHTTKEGKPRLRDQCDMLLTGRRCVTTVVTNLAVIDITPQGFALREVAPGVTVDEVRAVTAAPVAVPDSVPVMALDAGPPAPTERL